MAGIGKTTFAASIASSTEIRRTYNRICFINLGDKFIADGGVNNVTYSKFIRYPFINASCVILNWGGHTFAYDQ